MWRWGLAVLAMGVLLGGCDTPESGRQLPLPTGPGLNGQNIRTPAPSSPSLPAAADGTNVSACSDGTCEVSVGPGTAIPLPARTGAKNVKVTAVTRDRVTLTGEDSGDSSSGSCTGQSCDSNVSNGVFTITLGPDSEDTQNGLSIAVESVSDGQAVLKFDVAA